MGRVPRWWAAGATYTIRSKGTIPADMQIDRPHKDLWVVRRYACTFWQRTNVLASQGFQVSPKRIKMRDGGERHPGAIARLPQGFKHGLLATTLVSEQLINRPLIVLIF